VIYKVGGRMFPLIHVPKCKVCSSDRRFDIEHGVMRGDSYAALAREYGASTDHEKPISDRNIADHVKAGHFPRDLAVMRALVDQRAEQMGKDLDDWSDTLVDHVTLANVTIQRTFQRLMSGQIEPELADGAKMAEFLLKYEAIIGAPTDQEVWQRSFEVMYSAMAEIMSPEQMIRFKELAGPKVKAIFEQAEKRKQNALGIGASDDD
jgi:hypothetical protein